MTKIQRESSPRTSPLTTCSPAKELQQQISAAAASRSPISPVDHHESSRWQDDHHHDCCERPPFPEENSKNVSSIADHTIHSSIQTSGMSMINEGGTTTSHLGHSEITNNTETKKSPSKLVEQNGDLEEVTEDIFCIIGSSKNDLQDDTQHSSTESFLTNQSSSANNLRMRTQSNTSGANTDTAMTADLSSPKSDSSSSSPLLATAHNLVPEDDNSSASIGNQPMNGIGSGPSGQYLLRQDVFLPQFQKTEPSEAYARNKLFFENIDAAFEKCSISADFQNDKKGTMCPPILDADEVKNICKMCFGAMCVVFSSHNPSTTKIDADSKGDSSTDTISRSEGSDGSFTRHSKLSSAYQNSLEKDVFRTSIFMRHQRRLAGDGDISDSLHNIMVGFDLAGGSCGNSNNSGPSYDGTSIIDEGSTSGGADSSHASCQRPAVPLAVVFMLWTKLIATQLEERGQSKNNSGSVVTDRMVLQITERVKDVLVKDMSLLQLSHRESKSNKSNNVGSSEQLEAPTMEFLKINHDLHLQYGLHISQNPSLFSFFLKGNSSDQGCQRLKFSYRIFDQENWNPEHALNFILASSCLSCLYRTRTIDSMAEIEKMQVEYAYEMLPWHLMRCMQYQTVFNLLSDVSFVKRRLNNMDFADAANMHVADFEEFNDSVVGLMNAYPSLVADIEVDKAMTECYGLLGGLIRSKDSSRWQYEDKRENLSDLEDDEINLVHVKSVAKSLEALGDSLFRYKKEAESMKYYYRSLVRYEHINFIETRRLANATKPTKLFSDKTQLQMGGVLSRIAAVYECGNENADAMLCYEKALSFYSKCQSQQHAQGVAKTLASMGELHFTLKEYDSSLSCFNEALLLTRSMDENCDEVAANLLLVMGNVRREMGELNGALELFSEALYNKTLLYGKLHPEVGFIHHIIGMAYCEKPDLQKALAHFEDALKIRKDAVVLVQSYLPPNDKSGRIQSRELEVSESLEVTGKVYETLGDLDTSFIYYEESSAIHHNHLLDLASGESCVAMISDIVAVLQSESDCSSFIEGIYDHLQTTIDIGMRLCPIGRIFKTKLSFDDLIEIEGQMAEILLDMGTIRGAKFLLKMSELEIESDNICSKDFSRERRLATDHLEDSILLRKRRIDRLGDKVKDESKGTTDEDINYERITMAITLHEIGKLCSWLVIRNDIEEHTSRRLQLLRPTSFAIRDCQIAISYFEEAKEILQDSISISETLAYAHEDEDPFISRLHLTPSIYEEMLQTMAVLYRKLGEYDKSVECYNEFSVLLTRMALDESDEASTKEILHISQKEKVAYSSQCIGDILFDTGEFSRSLESYDESLQLRKDSGADSLVIADTLNKKGSTLLKLKRWDEAALSFNKALRIRVDRLSKDHIDIAQSFHFIGKAYQGHEKSDQALDYYKKAQRIISGRLVDTDTHAADLFYDLGKIVLLQDEAAFHYTRASPPDDEISLALTCLALSRDIYIRNFGDDALEVGNALSLLGEIYHKYGEVVKAISSYKRALSIFKGAPLDQSRRIRKTLVKLGLAIIDISPDDGVEVFDCYSLAQALYEEKEDYKNVEYADLIFFIGEAHLQFGKKADLPYFNYCPYYNSNKVVFVSLSRGL